MVELRGSVGGYEFRIEGTATEVIGEFDKLHVAFESAAEETEAETEGSN